MTRPTLIRLTSLALAASLSLGTAHARAAPSERDLAYELGVQAETDGDPGRAAAAFERAYRLTAPAETGPRLLFLRASVTARLRAAGPDSAGSPLARASLCQARTLLHDYLDPLTPGSTPDPAADERTRLAEVEQRLSLAAGPDCTTVLAPIATPAPAPPTEPTTTPTAPPTRPPPSQPPAPRPTPPPTDHRRERIAGGVALGVGATGLALLISGIVVNRRANARGHAVCREAMTGCTASGSQVRDIEVLGRRGDILLGVGAVVGGLGLVSGAVLLAVGLRKRGSPRVSWTPHVTPSSAGLALSGRF